MLLPTCTPRSEDELVFLAAALALVSRGEGIQPQNTVLDHSLLPMPENDTADTLDFYVLLIHFRNSMRTS